MTSVSITALDALNNRRLDKRKSTRYVTEGDERIFKGLILPHISPKFAIPAGGTVFTMGSCFARRIEQEITGVRLPATEISFGNDVVSGRKNSLLNEFNPASMSQRIHWAVDGQDTREFRTSLIGTPELSQDVLLAKGHPLRVDRLLDIRRQIDEVYKVLPQSDVLILTLGMTMVWQDFETGLYLNRMPDPRAMQKEPNRYRHFSLDTPKVVELLAQAIEKTEGTKVNNILLTISPVPLQATFFLEDCVISNSLSKATLRCAVDELIRIFPKKVDYFPSFEIVASGGLSAFQPDNIHIQTWVVKAIMDHMLQHYMVAE